jgi:hypothetical protein
LRRVRSTGKRLSSGELDEGKRRRRLFGNARYFPYGFRRLLLGQFAEHSNDQRRSIAVFERAWLVAWQVRYGERLDANPIEVLYDICINDWGMLGIVDPIFNMTSWRDAAYTCYDEGNGVSAEIANANQAGRSVQATASPS